MSSYLNMYVLVVMFGVGVVTAQKISNKDKGTSTSSPPEKQIFGKNDFLEFIKGKLKLSARIIVGGSIEGINFYTHVFFFF